MKLMDLIEVHKPYSSYHKTFHDLADKWSAILTVPVDPSQVILMLLELKMMRIQDNPDYHEEMMNNDTYRAFLTELLR
jgi:hypothetical protein